MARMARVAVPAFPHRVRGRTTVGEMATNENEDRADRSGLVALLCGLLRGDGGTGASGPAEPVAAEKELTKNPVLLISPALKAGELSVYGVKLGAATDKMPVDAGAIGMGVPERPQDAVHVGRNVRYYANDKKIYRITVMGDLTRQLPTYDAARLQMALGKADEVAESPSGEDTHLSFFARRVQYTVHAYRSVSVVAEVDLYAP